MRASRCGRMALVTKEMERRSIDSVRMRFARAEWYSPSVR